MPAQRSIATTVAGSLLFLCLCGSFAVVWWCLHLPAAAPFSPAPTQAAVLPASSYSPALIDLNQQIDLLSNWTVWRGSWKELHPGLRAEGESSADFDADLPGRICISFLMNVVDGMRPRIYLPGAGFFVGNEGFTKQIFVYGPGLSDVQGEPVPYDNGQFVPVSITLNDGSFRIVVNNHVITGKCKSSQHPRLRLEGGDGWSKGTTEFRDIRVEPINTP